MNGLSGVQDSLGMGKLICSREDGCLFNLPFWVTEDIDNGGLVWASEPVGRPFTSLSRF